LKRPKLNALRAFESAGRHLSFSSAGTELGVSQAAISQQIRNLENYLDARLFVRRNRGLSLTGIGEAYQLVVHEALDRLDTVTDQLFPETLDHVVTIQCTPSVAILWLIPKLEHFRDYHPEIQMRIVTLDSEHFEQQQSQVDLEISAQTPMTRTASDCRLITVEITPVCSPLLLKSKPVSIPSDLINHHLIHVLGYGDDWHRWFREFGLRSHKVPGGTSFDGSLMAMESAIKGGGIMLGRRPFIDQYLESNELVRPFGENYSLNATYFLRTTENTRRGNDIKVVRDWLVQTDPAGFHPLSS
jgi:LysR family glycine cleavage system transcriptional activator